MCSIFLRKPADLVDLFLNFQTLQIVELRLVTLERAVDVILRMALGQVFTLDTETSHVRDKPQLGVHYVILMHNVERKTYVMHS